MLPMAHMYGLAFEFIYEFASGAHVFFLTRTPVPEDHRGRILHGKTQLDYFRTLDYRKDHPEKSIPGTGKTID